MATTYTNEDGLTLYDILLGQYVSEQIKAIQDNFKALSANSEDINDKIEQVKNEAHKSSTFDTISALVNTLNALSADSDKSKYHIGDNFFIKELSVPDFWVSGIAETYVVGTAEAFAASQYHNIQVGWFILDKLETQHVDLSNTVTTDESALTENQILLGAGGKKTKLSGATIVKGGSSGESWSAASNNTVPTSLAVENRLAAVQESLNNSINNIISGTTIVGKAKQDQKGNVIDTTYATKEELQDIAASAGKIDTVKVNDTTLAITNKTVNIPIVSGDADTTKVETDTTGKTTITALGKVRDVTVNGTSVVSDGIAAITVADLAAGFVSITTTDSSWTTQTINGTTYQAIRVQKTDTALGVFNSNNQEIVIQKTYDANYLYLCVGTSKIACTIRKLSGGAVGSGGGGGSSPTYTLSKTTKYLHQIRLVVSEDDSAYTVHINFINESPNSYTTWSSFFYEMNRRENQGKIYNAWGHKEAVSSEYNNIYDIYAASVESTTDESRQNRMWFTCTGRYNNALSAYLQFAIMRSASGVSCYDSVIPYLEHVSLNQA